MFKPVPKWLTNSLFYPYLTLFLTGICQDVINIYMFRLLSFPVLYTCLHSLSHDHIFFVLKIYNPLKHVYVLNISLTAGQDCVTVIPHKTVSLWYRKPHIQTRLSVLLYVIIWALKGVKYTCRQLHS